MLIRNITAGIAAASLSALPLMAQTGQPLRAASATLAKPKISGKRLGQRVVQPAPEKITEGSALIGTLPLVALGAAGVAVAAAVAVAAVDTSPN